MLELDRQIREAKYPNCISFSKKWEVTQKTVQRDVNYIKYCLGAPLKYNRERRGYNYTDKSWFLPALLLGEGDLLAVLLAGRAMEIYQGTPAAPILRNIFEKITALLPEKVFIQPELINAGFSFTLPPCRNVKNEIWTIAARAMINRNTLAVKYQRPDDPEPHDFSLNPYHLANLQGEWYIFGTAGNDIEVKQYALSRMVKAELTGKIFIVPEDFDPAIFVKSAFGRFAVPEKVYDIRLLFDREAAEWVCEKVWQENQKITRRRNGSVELMLKAGGLYEIMRWVLSWGHQVRVLSPGELRDMVAKEISLMAAQDAKSTPKLMANSDKQRCSQMLMPKRERLHPPKNNPV